MGYDFHITRAANWANNSGLEIRASEWRALAREDPEFVEDPAHGPYAVVWHGSGDSDKGWFDWTDGNVYTTDPNPETLLKMLELSLGLDAQVQGDDGEFYRKEGTDVVRDEPAKR